MDCYLVLINIKNKETFINSMDFEETYILSNVMKLQTYSDYQTADQIGITIDEIGSPNFIDNERHSLNNYVGQLMGTVKGKRYRMAIIPTLPNGIIRRYENIDSKTNFLSIRLSILISLIDYEFKKIYNSSYKYLTDNNTIIISTGNVKFSFDYEITDGSFLEPIYQVIKKFINTLKYIVENIDKLSDKKIKFIYVIDYANENTNHQDIAYDYSKIYNELIDICQSAGKEEYNLNYTMVKNPNGDIINIIDIIESVINYCKENKDENNLVHLILEKLKKDFNPMIPDVMINNIEIIRAKNFNDISVVLWGAEIDDNGEINIDLVQDDIKFGKMDLYRQVMKGFNKYNNNDMEIYDKENYLEDTRFKLSSDKICYLQCEADESSKSYNITKLMSNVIQKLSKKTQYLLKLASSIGITFSLKVLANAYGKSLMETIDGLKELVENGIIMPDSENYLYIVDTNTGTNNDINSDKDLDMYYKFQNEHVQKAAYNMINNADKIRMHLKNGRYLLNNSSEEDLGKQILNITYQLNTLNKLIKNENELKGFIEFNIKAAERLNGDGTYKMAIEYVSLAEKVLPDYYWKKYYELSYKVYITKGISEYELQHFDKSKKTLNIVLNKAKNNIDKLKIYNEFITLYVKIGKFIEAINYGKTGLKLFDIVIPEDEDEIKKEINKIDKIINKKIGGRTPEQILDMHEKDDVKYISIYNALTSTTLTALNSMNHDLGNFCILKMMEILLTHGNCRNSMLYYILTLYSVYLSKKNDRKDKAYEWGNSVIKKIDKLNNPFFKGSIYNLYATRINHIKNHERTSIFYYEKAIDCAIESGKIISATISKANLAMLRLDVCEDLNEILEYINDAINFSKKTRQKIHEKVFYPLKYAVLNLLGLTKSPSSYSTDKFDEDAFLKEIIEEKLNIPIHWYFYNKFKVLIILNEYKKIVELFELYKTNPIVHSKGVFYCIALYSLYDGFTEKEKKRYYKIMKGFLDQLNEKDKKDILFILAKATIYDIDGDYEKADEYFNKAINMAEKKDNSFFIGITNEYAARYHLKIRSIALAKGYINNSYSAYKKWGAKLKLRILEETYPELIKLN